MNTALFVACTTHTGTTHNKGARKRPFPPVKSKEATHVVVCLALLPIVFHVAARLHMVLV